jgi:hypothetical protein
MDANTHCDTNKNTYVMKINEDTIMCPITKNIFKDPVTISDGRTYEHHAIAKWLTKSSSSPIINIKLMSKRLVKNFIIKGIVEDYLNQHPEKIHDRDGFIEPHELKKFNITNFDLFDTENIVHVFKNLKPNDIEYLMSFENNGYEKQNMIMSHVCEFSPSATIKCMCEYYLKNKLNSNNVHLIEECVLVCMLENLTFDNVKYITQLIDHDVMIHKQKPIMCYIFQHSKQCIFNFVNDYYLKNKCNSKIFHTLDNTLLTCVFERLTLDNIKYIIPLIDDDVCNENRNIMNFVIRHSKKSVIKNIHKYYLKNKLNSNFNSFDEYTIVSIFKNLKIENIKYVTHLIDNNIKNKNNIEIMYYVQKYSNVNIVEHISIYYLKNKLNQINSMRYNNINCIFKFLTTQNKKMISSLIDMDNIDDKNSKILCGLNKHPEQDIIDYVHDYYLTNKLNFKNFHLIGNKKFKIYH